MADPLKVNSKNYKQQAAALPAPTFDVLPPGGDFVGALKQSDRATLAAPGEAPPPEYPGSKAPGQPWRSVDPAPRKRGAFRG